MKKKPRAKRINRNFPEGAISAATVSKISNIYLSRVLEEDGASDLMPVIEAFSEGKILEHVGQMKKARDTFKEILKKNPRNKWAIEALQNVEINLH
jgi:hypothetical protein